MLLSAGGTALAYSYQLDKLKEEWINKVDMHYSQMEANAGSYVIAQLENYVEEKKSQFNEDMEKYLHEVASEDAVKMMEPYEKEIEEGKKKIDEEFAKLEKEIKKYIDNKY